MPHSGKRNDAQESLRMCSKRLQPAGRAGNSRACCGGDNVAVAMGDVRRPSCCRTERARRAWRMEVRAAGRMRGRTREGAGRKCAAEPFGRQVTWAKGGSAGGSQGIAKCNA